MDHIVPALPDVCNERGTPMAGACRVRFTLVQRTEAPSSGEEGTITQSRRRTRRVGAYRSSVRDSKKVKWSGCEFARVERSKILPQQELCNTFWPKSIISLKLQSGSPTPRIPCSRGGSHLLMPPRRSDLPEGSPLASPENRQIRLPEPQPNRYL